MYLQNDRNKMSAIMSKANYFKIKTSLTELGIKPNNPVVKDLLTSKYRMRTVEKKTAYKRKEKYVKTVDFCY